MLEEGKKAPNFNLTGDDGKTHRLSDFKGNYLVLYFYPKDDTPGCTIEAKEYTKMGPDFGRFGIKVVGISKDDFESHCRFRDKYGLTVLLLSDPDAATIKEYDSWGSRGIFGVGTLRNTYVIDPEGRIAKAYEKVKPDANPGEVLEFIKSRKELKSS